jgi:hypothetical protein
MKTTPSEIYVKIKQLNQDVKEKLKRQGVVVPVRKNDGTIQIGNYLIKREPTGYYSIINYRNDVIVGNINLPQTAAITANKLALGKWVDDDILRADAAYGHALFDEQVHKRLAERSLQSNDVDKAAMMFTKTAIDKYKKEQNKLEVTKGFEKLMRFR